MGYYSVPRKGELSSHEKTWSKLKHVPLSERSQSEKTSYGMIPSNILKKAEL